MKNQIIRFIDFTRKKKIFELARLKGLDGDGDILVYKNTWYYVHVFKKQIQRVNGTITTFGNECAANSLKSFCKIITNSCTTKEE